MTRAKEESLLHRSVVNSTINVPKNQERHDTSGIDFGAAEKGQAKMASDDENDGLSWYDYQPGKGIPDHVTHLRIGVQQALAAAQNGSIPQVIELPEAFCFQHPNLQQVQIHVQTVRKIPAFSFGDCSKLEWSLSWSHSHRKEQQQSSEINPGKAHHNCTLCFFFNVATSTQSLAW
eukprot:CAMPEP_0168775130 /NCGR_PEP_ID=MMETSP0725-20121227/5354_1 /TAXON_ID=265536 /ORGANISM="Amphiprora sp., Strain CCMP467" /LENGTH=175 /DNA_ID=CAMNT_0008824751 /DNA_START=327 /DNA_END=852 /DNA_ORIENTATION=-